MEKGKEYRIIIYTVLALMVNLLGRSLAAKLALPVWLDSVGTFLIAYVSGPVCGAIVGFTNNIIYGIFVEQQSVYCIVGALLGIVVGYFAKKRVFDTQFQTMTFGMGLAIFSTFVATMINTILYNGMSGNIWGNQVMLLCIDSGLPNFISYIFGQFCVEFLDKLVCSEIVYLLLAATRYKRKNERKNVEKVSSLCLVFILIGILSQGESVRAQNKYIDYDSYIQREYSDGEGLLSGEANDIGQTKDGKLWIGTYAGLFRYDGNKFKLFKDVPSVKNVNCLYVDEEGRLWVGTNDDGVTTFINENVMNVIDEEMGLLSNTVKCITCDSNGNYYMGTPEGLSLVTLASGVKVTKSFEQIKNIIHMSADMNGNVAVITDRGAIYWMRDTEIIETPLNVDAETSFRAVSFTEDNRLFLATTENDVLIYDMTSGLPHRINTISLKGIESINSFYFNENGEVFVCSDTGVIVLQTDGTYVKLNTNNFTSSIDHMLIDYQGNLWFSSSRLGLLELSKSPFEELFPEVGENAVVNSTQKWEGLLYCGTDKGLIILDEEKKEKVENEISALLNSVRIRCQMVDSSDNLWIATMGMGIYRVSKKADAKYEIRKYSENDGLPGMRFRNICELEDGRIAAAGDYGMAILEDDTVTQVFTAQDGMENEKSLCLLEYKNALYIGSDGGGITKVENDKITCNIAKKDGLSSDVILRMVYDPYTDGMFIVTSNGLCYMSPEEEIKILDNFPYSNNYDMICNWDGTCWIMSSAGIYVAETEDLIQNQKMNYPLMNVKRGLRSSLVANSWLCVDEDDVYLCCDTSVVKVKMSHNDMSAKSYRMVLDYVEVDGVQYEINRVDTFNLSSSAEKIAFEPEVLNYSMDDPYVSIYMEGYDTKETVCLLSELDKLTYSNLNPGTYVFRMAILDELDGKIVESGRYIIEKETEMYQNWWFKLYVFMIVGLVLVWTTWFLTRTQAQKTLLKQKYELEYAKKQIKMGNETILSIARTVDAKDSNTSQHSFRVSEYSVAIAKRLNYSEEKCENLRQMALLHDIGKIGIPDAILNKPGRLTEEEYKVMKTHVIRGGEILKDFTMIDNVSVGALYHHEKYDGTGYCHGLKGEEIPLDARIIGIADAFDAMTANRVYRKHLDIDVVIAELKRCSGTQFDPELVEILLSLIEDKTINVENLYEKSREDR